MNLIVLVITNGRPTRKVRYDFIDVLVTENDIIRADLIEDVGDTMNFR